MQIRRATLKLSNSLGAWNTPAFKQTLKDEIEQLDSKVLPLQQGLSHSSYASEGKFSVIVLGVVEEPDVIRVKTGIFYNGLIMGCSCADDPTPMNEINEYCEVQFEIIRETAETIITLCRDE